MQRRQYPSWDHARFDGVIRHFNVQPKQKIGTLSRGERAGVSLALALAQGPELLILDEPTLGLDIVAKRAFLETLMFANLSAQATIVYCSHQVDEIERLADNLVVLERGALRHMSEPANFSARVRLWIAGFPARLPDIRNLPGVLQAELIDGMVHVLVFDRGDAFGEELSRLGAYRVHSASVSLERAINAFPARGHISNQPLPNAA